MMNDGSAATARDRYRERVAVVTGAGSGIGLAIVRGLLAEGATVVVNDLTVDAFADAGENLVVVQGDVADPATVAALREAARDSGAGGRVDALFNHAGIAAYGPALDLTPDDWRRVMAVNVDAAISIATSIGRLMVEQGRGAIVNTASVAGTFGIPNAAPYVVTKHAVVGLTRALALEWGPHGVRVNALCPGLTATGMSTVTRREHPGYWAQREAIIPLRRAGRPEEQASVALFLNSDEASYVNGLIAEVDGGAHTLYAGRTIDRPTG